MSTRALSLVCALAAVVAMAGCSSDDPSPEEANPASEFCISQGGEVEIVDEADGQVGYCNLPDGTRIDEWEYFRANSTTTQP